MKSLWPAVEPLLEACCAAVECNVLSIVSNLSAWNEKERYPAIFLLIKLLNLLDLGNRYLSEKGHYTVVKGGAKPS